MQSPSWQLQTPIDAVIFDCDGTLSSIEGIDELAKNNGTTDIVQRLTADAMGKSGITPELYEKRLALVQPTQTQVLALGQQYIAHAVPEVGEIIQLLKRLNKTVYIVSAGLKPAVIQFADSLRVPAQNVFAVDVQFDAEGCYVDFDRHSTLIDRQGKREVVMQIKKQHPELAFVGDGLNDLAVRDLVARFVGYGGSYYRENIAVQCDFYIKTFSMATLLPLVLTPSEVNGLNEEDNTFYQKAIVGMADGVKINL